MAHFTLSLRKVVTTSRRYLSLTSKRDPGMAHNDKLTKVHLKLSQRSMKSVMTFKQKKNHGASGLDTQSASKHLPNIYICIVPGPNNTEMDQIQFLFSSNLDINKLVEHSNNCRFGVELSLIHI